MKKLTAHEILGIPSALATGLPADVVARLPDATPAAPWRSHAEMAFWVFRAGAAARRSLPASVRAGPPVGTGGFVHYLDGAVGSYHEILASPTSVRGGLARAHIPFIAVDSIPSIHGGRTNWALPKILAEFSGSPASDSRLHAEGDRWRVTATVRHHGAWFPIALGGSCGQPWPDGTLGVFASTVRGRAKLATLELDVDGPESLTSWLRGGRHLGLVVRGSITVAAPHHLPPDECQ